MKEIEKLSAAVEAGFDFASELAEKLEDKKLTLIEVMGLMNETRDLIKALKDHREIFEEIQNLGPGELLGVVVLLQGELKDNTKLNEADIAKVANWLITTIKTIGYFQNK